MVEPPDAEPIVALLEVVVGPRAQTVFSLTARPYLIGRSVDSDIVLPHPSVSRSHARLVPVGEGGGFRIEDLGSTHGTIVGDERVTRVDLPSGALLHLGNVTLRFLVADPEAKTVDHVDRALEAGGVAGVTAQVLDALQL